MDIVPQPPVLRNVNCPDCGVFVRTEFAALRQPATYFNKCEACQKVLTSTIEMSFRDSRKRPAVVSQPSPVAVSVAVVPDLVESAPVATNNETWELSDRGALVNLLDFVLSRCEVAVVSPSCEIPQVLIVSAPVVETSSFFRFVDDPVEPPESITDDGDTFRSRRSFPRLHDRVISGTLADEDRNVRSWAREWLVRKYRGDHMRGIRFNRETVTIDYLHGLWKQQEGKCALSGLPMAIAGTRGCPTRFVGDEEKLSGHTRPYMVSVDRIDSDLPYEAGNLQLICTVINAMKSNLKQDIFIDLCKKITATARKKPSKAGSEV